MREKIKNEIESAKSNYEYLNKNYKGVNDLKLFKNYESDCESKNNKSNHEIKNHKSEDDSEIQSNYLNTSEFINDESESESDNKSESENENEDDEDSFIDDKSIEEKKEKKKRFKLVKKGKKVVNKYKEELNNLKDDLYDGEDELNNEDNEEDEDLSSSNSSTSNSEKRKFSDNLDLILNDDHYALNKKIQESVDKMFEHYKYSSKNNEEFNMIIYYGSNKCSFSEDFYF